MRPVVAAPAPQSTTRKGDAVMNKILCVEDNQDNLFMLQRRLTRRGFDVTISTDGAQSVEWAKTLLPDLIVMDLNLPVLDGWEATRRLKNQPETKHIPIIVLTADATQESRKQALAAGCDEFETKPIDFEGLIRKIQSVLSRSAKP
jgi:CheY-like chemotaxis protein